MAVDGVGGDNGQAPWRNGRSRQLVATDLSITGIARTLKHATLGACLNRRRNPAITTAQCRVLANGSGRCTVDGSAVMGLPEVGLEETEGKPRSGRGVAMR